MLAYSTVQGTVCADLTMVTQILQRGNLRPTFLFSDPWPLDFRHTEFLLEGGTPSSRLVHGGLLRDGDLHLLSKDEACQFTENIGGLGQLFNGGSV